jgi:hypothetical protein
MTKTATPMTKDLSERTHMPYDPTVDQQRWQLMSNDQPTDRSVPQATPEGKFIETPPTQAQQQWELMLKDPSFRDRLIGAGETAAMVGASPIGYLAGILGAGYGTVTGQDPRETGAKWEHASSYQPQTPVGQYYGEQVGAKLNALPPIVSGIPHMRLGPKAGRFAAETYAKPVAEMAADLYMTDQMPGMVSPASYAVDPSKRRFLGFGAKEKTPEIDLSPKTDMPLTVPESKPLDTLEGIAKAILEKPMTRRELFETAGNAVVSHAGRSILGDMATKPIAEMVKSVAKEPSYFYDLDILHNLDLYGLQDLGSAIWPDLWNDNIKPRLSEDFPLFTKADATKMDALVKRLDTENLNNRGEQAVLSSIEDIMEKYHDPLEGDPKIAKSLFNFYFGDLDPITKIDELRNIAYDLEEGSDIHLTNKQLAKYLKDRGHITKDEYKDLKEYYRHDEEE